MLCQLLCAHSSVFYVSPAGIVMPQGISLSDAYQSLWPNLLPVCPVLSIRTSVGVFANVFSSIWCQPTQKRSMFNGAHHSLATPVLTTSNRTFCGPSLVTVLCLMERERIAWWSRLTSLLSEESRLPLNRQLFTPWWVNTFFKTVGSALNLLADWMLLRN